MARIVTKIGNVFSARLDEDTKKYFQYVANDLTQLNSDVIRVFKKIYSVEESPDLSNVVNDEVDFYAHCVIKWGIKLGCWEKVGKAAEIGKVDVLFRDASDYGSKPGEHVISYNWWVWRINEEQQYVGKLEGKNQKSEIGLVFAPNRIVHRMRTGKYNIVYPDYQ